MNSHEIIADDLADQLALQLSDDMKEYPMSQLGITRWVLAESLKQPDYGDSLYSLSHQLSEEIYAHLEERALRLVEFRSQDYISLSKAGAVVLSREAEELNAHSNLDWVLVGTMSRKDDGAMINLRIIDRRSQQVLAAANRYVPKHLYWSNKQTELVNGHLQRN
ncbi:FlgO family outer membrane protein [Idiomarina sp. Sol25]|nr:FlgO family outer membrane protein [Idiomarina sp. Sol25]